MAPSPSISSSILAISQFMMQTHLSQSSSLRAANRNLSSAKYHSSSLLVQVKLLERDLIQLEGFLISNSWNYRGLARESSIIAIRCFWWASSFTWRWISLKIFLLILRFYFGWLSVLVCSLCSTRDPLYSWGLSGDSEISLALPSFLGEGFGIK